MKMKRVVQFSIICWLTVIVSTSNIGNDRQDINLSNDGGYTDILIAISERVPENPDIINKLQAYFTEASSMLLNATKNRMYFKNVTIVIPSNWTMDPTWEKAEEGETFRRARVVVAEANAAYGNIPYTLQPGGCGEEGDYIHFTPEYLAQNMSDGLPYKPAKRIVKEFSQLKWGLFDETVPLSDRESPRFYNEDKLPKAIGCLQKSYIYMKNPRLCTRFADTGVLNYPCDFTLIGLEGTASLLSFEYWDDVTEFCTNETEGTTAHNKLATNLQNKNCDGRSAWEVMHTLPDFAVDYGALRNSTLPPDPIFQIVQTRSSVPIIITATTTTTTPPTATTTTTTSPTTTSTTITPPPATTSTTTPTTTTATTTSTTATTTTMPTTESSINTEVTDECEQDIVCLCLDVSGSMSTNNRIGIMSEAVQNYILQYIRNNTAVGIVSFSTSAYLRADMTEVISDDVRSHLASRVPTSTIGGTNIGAGLMECQRILRAYAGEDVDKSRVVMFSDGQGSIGTSVDDIIADGIELDTVLYGQGGFLADQAKATGGEEIFASDTFGELKLSLFFASSASKGCDPENSDAVLQNYEIFILAGQLFYTNGVYFDVTIGLNTKIVFKYTVEVNVTISIEQDLIVSYNRNVDLKTITVTVAGEMEGYLEYTITKLIDISVEVACIVTVTSSPIPGVQQIVIADRVSANNIDFTPTTQLIGYLGAFQGLTPVLQLTVTISIEQPNGKLITVIYKDDGTGKDSVPNDGIYTGCVFAHSINGSGGTFFGVTIDISGEGVLPGQQTNNQRKKRCTDCNSLGNITRSDAGGVVVIKNWQTVDDMTPPDRITDLRVLNAAAAGDNIFTLGWTAPGDDLNIGTVTGYEFAVSADESVNNQINLPADAILSDVSAFLVSAGSSLQMSINTSEISPEMFGLSQSSNISTYYFRMTTFDAKTNFASWSNPASASYVDPDTFAALVVLSSTSPTTSTSSISSTSSAPNMPSTTDATTTSEQTPEMVTKTPLVLIIAMSVLGFLVLAVIVGAIVFCCYKSHSSRSERATYGYRESESNPGSSMPDHCSADSDRYSYYTPSNAGKTATRDRYGQNFHSNPAYDFN